MSWVAIAGAVLFFLGILASVALHELGHMIPAKLFGVKVTQYMVGFGKTLWSRKKGETEYGIKLIPAGGYVRMIGMFPPAPDGTVRRSSTGMFQSLVEQAREAEGESIEPGDERRVFYAKPWWQKLIIMCGGPMVNVIIAVVLFGVVLIGFGVPQPTLTLSSVPDCVIPVKAQRAVCNDKDPKSPAKAAGFRVGDTILAFDGTKATSWDQLSGLIRDHGAGMATVTVRRGSQTLALHPKLIESERPSTDDPTKYVKVGFIGVSPTEQRVHQGPAAVFEQVGSYTVLTVEALGHIPQRMVGVAKAAFGQQRELDSPMSVIGASRVAGEIAATDTAPVSDRIATFVQWLGAVNLFFALFNFVPLLPLDGGHIAGAIWEALKRGVARLRRRPDPGYVDVAKALPIAYAVASILIVMGVLLVYADIVNPVRLPN